MADRIVVMQDGRIEQIGTPLELYDHPANLFVAQFIGSPSMNVVHGVLHRSKSGEASIEAEGGVAGRCRPALRAPRARPSPMACARRPRPRRRRSGGARLEVIVVEPTGAETELLLQVGGAQIVAVLHGRTQAGPGDVVQLAVDTGAVHLFDPTSGTTLRYR